MPAQFKQSHAVSIDTRGINMKSKRKIGYDWSLTGKGMVGDTIKTYLIVKVSSPIIISYLVPINR